MTTMTIRYRLNCQLPDAEKKYRDELTQEAEVSLENSENGMDPISSAVESKARDLRDKFYAEAKRLGEAEYIEARERAKLVE